MNFQISVRDSQGVLCLLMLAASSEHEAQASALAKGYEVLSVSRNQTQPMFGARGKGIRLRNNKWDPGQFADELGALLDAGLSLLECLQTLGSREQAKVRNAFYGPIEKALMEGKPLSVALSTSASRVPPLLIATIRASEQTGDMANGLRRFAQTHKRLRAVKEKIISASIYPVILSVVGLCVLIFLLGIVVPRFAGLINSNGRQVADASRLLMDWGKLVNAHFNEIVISLIGLIVLSAAVLSRHSVRSYLSAQAVHLPVVGSYLRLYRQNQFWQTSAMLVDGGIPAPQAFKMASPLLGLIDLDLLRQASARIDAGQNLAESFNAAGLVDGVAYRMLQVAQKTGQLGRVLGQLAAFQGETLERGLDRLTRLIEPILMITIGVAVGGIVVLMYLPIFDLASSIQ